MRRQVLFAFLKEMPLYSARLCQAAKAGTALCLAALSLNLGLHFRSDGAPDRRPFAMGELIGS